MNDCQRVQELIPWYVNGTLNANENAFVASHIAQCASCREHLANTLYISLQLKQSMDNQPRAPEYLYDKVRTQKGEFRLGSLDIGSFLLGLSLGLSITRKGRARLTSNLSLLGKRVPIYDTKAKEESNGNK